MANTRMPKYLEISQKIEECIRNGTWTKGKIPSVRGVAEDHQVSIVTASRALQVLRDKGLIETVERSGCYIVDQSNRTIETWALVLRLTQVPWLQATEAVARRGFDNLANRQGLNMRVDLFDISARTSDRELSRQVEMAREQGVGGVFFMPSRVSDDQLRLDERFLAACRRGRLPVVFLERNLRGSFRALEYDIVGTDDVGAGAATTRHLLQTGCRRIAMIVGSPINTHDERAAGYMFALHHAHHDPELLGGKHPPLVLYQDFNLSMKESCHRLVDQIIEQEIDGVICFNDYTGLGLIMELMTRGKQVPEDVSVVGFDDLPIGQSFAIQLTTYKFPSDEMAYYALERMRQRMHNPHLDPVKIVIPGKLILRESTRQAVASVIEV